jgi:hypothetical protein
LIQKGVQQTKKEILLDAVRILGITTVQTQHMSDPQSVEALVLVMSTIMVSIKEALQGEQIL